MQASLPYELVSPLSGTPLRTVSATRRRLMLSLDRDTWWARVLLWLLYWWGPDPYLVATGSDGASYLRAKGHAAFTGSSVGGWGCAACGFSDEDDEVAPTSVQCVPR